MLMRTHVGPFERLSVPLSKPAAHGSQLEGHIKRVSQEASHSIMVQDIAGL